MNNTPRIQDYAAIGDGRSAALISSDGSLDWLCWPRFDSPSLFAALLDRERGGCWSIKPDYTLRTTRRYIAATNILQSEFETRTGRVVLTDFMPAVSEEEKRRSLFPEHELIRRLECQRGEVEVQVLFDPRPDYGRRRATIASAGRLGLRFEIGSSLCTLLSDVPLRTDSEVGAAARITLKVGDTADFSLSWSAEAPAVLAPLGDLVTHKLALSIDWWQRWANQARYAGPYRAQVQRSALALKLLSYAPSGAIVAAPTASLPERLGGDKNWDYRFCWLRDAAFTARALYGLGYEDEANAFVSWLLHATRLTRPKLRVMYDVFGEASLKESELKHFQGYAGSRPVRIGNAAEEQLQLDVYGEVIEAVTHFVRRDGHLDRETQRMLCDFGKYVCRHWREPDSGIWEVRGVRRHFTHSRLLCWVALDRLIEIQRRGRLQGIPADQFQSHRDAIRRDIEERAWNEQLHSYAQVLDGEGLDASVLLLAFHGFEDAASSRMQRSYQRIRDGLGAGPGLLYRNQRSMATGEGAFAICSFWSSDFLARGGGSLEEARDEFERTAGYANDLGLFAEQIDPTTGEALGNFPQAFTHVGLINAALSLAQREEGTPGDRSATGAVVDFPVDPQPSASEVYP